MHAVVDVGLREQGGLALEYLDRSTAPGGGAPGQQGMVVHIGAEQEAHVLVEHLGRDQLSNQGRRDQR